MSELGVRGAAGAGVGQVGGDLPASDGIRLPLLVVGEEAGAAVKVKIGSGCRFVCRKTHVHRAGTDGSIHAEYRCRRPSEAAKASLFANTLTHDGGYKFEEFVRTTLARQFAVSRIVGRDILYFSWRVPDSLGLGAYAPSR